MKWAQDYYNWSNIAKVWDERIRISLQNPERKYGRNTNTTTTEITADSESITSPEGTDVRLIQGSSSGEEQVGDSGRPIGSNDSNRQDKDNPRNRQLTEGGDS